MSRDPGAAVIDYGKPPDRRRRRRWLIILAVALALALGVFIASVQVRQELARRAAVLQAQQVALERARLNRIFAEHQEALRALEAGAAERDVQRAASTGATTQPAARRNPRD